LGAIARPRSGQEWLVPRFFAGLDASTLMAMRARASGRLLDRDAETGAIIAAISAAAAGSGSALIVEGVAGIGKTALLSRARELATREGMTILSARSGEFEGSYPWGVVRQLFDRIVRDDSADGPRRLLRDAGRLAAPALGLSNPGGSSGGQRDEEFAILHGLYWLTADMARTTPVLLMVDDLHWADRPSLSFAAHLIRRLDGLPVLLIGSARPVRAAEDGGQLLGSIHAEPTVTVIRPGPLGQRACARLLGGVLAAAPEAEFTEACHEMTGGNPFLLRALADSLAADGVAGRAANAGHVRRMTPAAVSRRVLLQLGRMPPAALAIARAITVLGPVATTARVGQLADSAPAASLACVEALMAERLVEGQDVLTFVHPLVRSAVQQDMAAPVRQHLHEQAARLLSAQRQPLQAVAVHLLESGPGLGAWAVGVLREAAADAQGSGAPGVARRYLERALTEVSDAGARADLLQALGGIEVAHAPDLAVGHLTEAMATAAGERRAAIALPLGHALAQAGRFAQAVDVLTQGITQLGESGPQLRAELQVALIDTARWDPASHSAAEELLTDLRARTDRGEQVAGLLHASLATYLTSVQLDRPRALRHARQALPAAARMSQFNSPIVPETISVFLFADCLDEAQRAVQAWLGRAQDSGLPLASSVAASFASLVALHAGAVSQSAAWARQALDASGSLWASPIAVSLLVLGLIERGNTQQAHDELAARGLTGELPPTWPANRLRYARGCLRAATGDHQGAVDDLLTAGEFAGRWEIRNPAMMSWRSAAALSLSALGRDAEARGLCAEELELARGWGASRGVGIALRAAGLAARGGRGLDLLSEAADVLSESPARLEYARVLADMGAALRRSGSRVQARAPLSAALSLAYAQGGLALAERARGELVIAGGRPRRQALRGRDALTPSELRVAQLAAQGKTNRQIAQELFVTLRTAETHLTSTYAKLGIGSRDQLAAALANSAQPS
jgi:DNA-binding CsgD family transcriptional regulator/tetratricopeptide (TPR) repeat protein